MNLCGVREPEVSDGGGRGPADEVGAPGRTGGDVATCARAAGYYGVPDGVQDPGQKAVDEDWCSSGQGPPRMG